MQRYFTRFILFAVFFGLMAALSASLAQASGPPAPLPKTGRTTITNAGDDGDFQKGVTWPNPRFTDNNDGTVKDNLTGLVWMKNAGCWGDMSWYAALDKVAALSAVVNPATCTGYTGNFKDWRLPSIRELTSLEDLSRTSPVLPVGHPFSGVQPYYYWSGSTDASPTSYAWRVSLGSGDVGSVDKAGGHYVWPVRGGQ